MNAQGATSPGRFGTLFPLTLTAVGVVYGDIGTSPLYAIRECFFGSHSVSPTHENVLGVLSLVLYALILVISIKYTAVVLRADNQGEGGILSLTALLPSGTSSILVALGIIGASLLLGEGMITPAVSILSAIEGLQVATPVFSAWVVPIAVVILVILFVIQRHGTHRVGGLFGPVMVLWFITIAALGFRWIVQAPEVLGAVDPRHAVTFFVENGWHGFAVLGAVVLVVTGAEALYADMGHFGRFPIRLAWFCLVLPALLINYFGQGALLLIRGEDAPQPFFMMAPTWALIPMVVLSTAAAIIASQALISGAFSLTRQAIQLGYAPRLDIQHTSSMAMGQVYVPQVNWFLAICTVLITVGFRSSSALAAAYGIAVTGTMIITTLLLCVVAIERWKWPKPAVFAVALLFLAIDLSLFGANLLKIFQGGWLPLVIGALLFTLMTTWKTGRRLVADRLTARAFPLEDFMTAVSSQPPTRVTGTAVFMTAQPRGTPPALAHNLRYNKILHEHVIVLTVTTTHTPYVPPGPAGAGAVVRTWLSTTSVFSTGFMQDPDVPSALLAARDLGVELDLDDLTYFLGRETIIVTRRPGMAAWREKLFVVMARNAVRATAFFHLPPERVVELGVQVEV